MENAPFCSTAKWGIPHFAAYHNMGTHVTACKQNGEITPNCNRTEWG